MRDSIRLSGLGSNSKVRQRPSADTQSSSQIAVSHSRSAVVIQVAPDPMYSAASNPYQRAVQGAGYVLPMASAVPYPQHAGAYGCDMNGPHPTHSKLLPPLAHQLRTFGRCGAPGNARRTPLPVRRGRRAQPRRLRTVGYARRRSRRVGFRHGSLERDRCHGPWAFAAARGALQSPSQLLSPCPKGRRRNTWPPVHARPRRPLDYIPPPALR